MLQILSGRQDGGSPSGLDVRPPTSAVSDPSARCSERWRRRLATIGAAFLWLAVLAAARAWWAGSPAPDAPKLPSLQDVALHLLMAPALGAIGWSYVKLWFDLPPRQARRQLLAWSLALAGVAALALPLTSNDVFSYMAYGRMMHLGLDPGGIGPAALPPVDPFRALVSQGWMSSPSVYAPASLALFWLVTFAGSAWPSLLLYKLLSLLIAWATVAVAYHACEATLPETKRPAALVITILNPLFLWEVAGQAHNDGVMVLLSFGAVALLYRERARLSAAGLALGMLVKSAAAPVLFFVGVQRMPRLRDRYFGVTCAFGAALVGVALWMTPSLLLTVNAPFGGVDVTKRLSNSVPALLFGMAGLAGPDAAFDAYRIYWVLSVALVTAYVLYAAQRTESPQDVVEHSLRALLLIVIVFAPSLQPWYFLWVLPFAGFSASEPLRRLVVFGSAGFLLLYIAPIWLPSWLFATALWLAVLTIVSSEAEGARATVQAAARARQSAAIPRQW